MQKYFLDDWEWSQMAIVELLQWAFCMNVPSIKPYQITDLEIGDGEMTIFGVTFVLLDHVLELFSEVLMSFLSARLQTSRTNKINRQFGRMDEGRFKLKFLATKYAPQQGVSFV